MKENVPQISEIGYGESIWNHLDKIKNLGNDKKNTIMLIVLQIPNQEYVS